MTDAPCLTPVVLLVFNRPALTKKMLDQLRQARPRQVLVVADGPRPDRPGDAEACAQVREIIAQGIDWEAAVLTDYAPVNLGLRRRVSSGLDWAFGQVEQAIVLEDDCVPHPSFFRFCEEMLQHYQHDTRLGVITGDNFQPQPFACAASYYFSRYNHCWGWATWRRAWKFFDEGMTHWPALREAGWLDGMFPDPGHALYWTKIFNGVHERRINSWAYAWTFACWSQHLLTAIPRANLVTKIGFGEEATHTRGGGGAKGNLNVTQMDFPLRHPPCVVRDHAADDYSQRHVLGSARVRQPFFSRWRRLFGKIQRRG